MDRKTLDLMKASPAAFRRKLQIEVGSELVAFKPDPWQRDCFEAMDGACRRLVGLPAKPDEPCLARHLWLRPRGHSKTQDAAITICWLLFASPRKLSGVLAAGDHDQARLILDAVTRILSANPWLSGFVTVERTKVYNPHTGSEAIVLTSDAPTSFGLLVDFVWMDEIVHWSEKDDLFQSLASAVSKKPFCLLAISSNAGWTGTWQHALTEQIRANPLWHVSWLDGVQASWWTEQQKTEPRGLLSVQGFQRLFLNQFVTNESRAMTDDDLEAACVLSGPMTSDMEIRRHLFVGSLDIGIKHDRSGFTVLAVEPGRPQIKLAFAKSWKAPPQGQVNVSDIQRTIEACQKRFNLRGVWFDPSQGLFLGQLLRNAGVTMHEMPFTPANCDAMAQGLVSGFRDNRLAIWRHVELLADMRKLVVKESNAFGKMRLTAVQDATGHADLGIAYSIGIPAAQALAASTATSGHYATGWRSEMPERAFSLGIFARGTRLPTFRGRDRLNDGRPTFTTESRI